MGIERFMFGSLLEPCAKLAMAANQGAYHAGLQRFDVFGAVTSHAVRERLGHVRAPARLRRRPTRKCIILHGELRKSVGRRRVVGDIGIEPSEPRRQASVW